MGEQNEVSGAVWKTGSTGQHDPGLVQTLDVGVPFSKTETPWDRVEGMLGTQDSGERTKQGQELQSQQAHRDPGNS